MESLDLTKILSNSFSTLGTIVNEKDHLNFRELLYYIKFSTMQENKFPLKFDFSGTGAPDELATWLLKEGYCTRHYNIFIFTPKTIEIFEKTIKMCEELKTST